MDLRSNLSSMRPYDVHKSLINEYILKNRRRDATKDRTDIDVLRDNHRFLWDTSPLTWEEQFAKKYYDKLFKEYCIGDLSRYKENKIALRWRTEQEVITGKGQFICGNKKCNGEDNLKTWEVNFGYVESGEKKNKLVKIRLCTKCSEKLNFHTKKKEVKRLKRKDSSSVVSSFKRASEASTSAKSKSSISAGISESLEESEKVDTISTETNPWENLKPTETKSRDEEMDDYLEELLL